MPVEGGEETRLTEAELLDDRPDYSQDCKWIVYVTFGTHVPAGSHPANKDVMLRLMDLQTKEIR